MILENDLFLESHVAEAELPFCDRGKIEIVEGASHWLYIEQPECINARIVDLLRA